MTDNVVGRARLIVVPDMKDVGPTVDRESKTLLGRMKGIAAPIAGAFAGAFALQKVGTFFSSAISGASDLGESISKSRVVFGPFSRDVEKFAEGAAKSMGQTRQQALEAAGTFGNLAVALGLPQKSGAEMSTTLVKLAGDLASFNNVKPEEALLALRSGLTGETEPLKKFGVNLNDATLKEKALSLGLIDTTKGVLPPAIKAQAAYALILEQTKTAQGDFARTSGGLANQQRILSAQWGDMKTAIGQVFLPAVTGVVTFFNSTLMPTFTTVGRFLSARWKEFVAGFSDGVRDLPLQQLGGFFRETFDFIRSVIDRVVSAIRVLFGDKDAWGFAEIADNILGNTGKLIPVFRGLGEWILKVAGFVRDHFKPIMIALGVAIGLLVSPIGVAIAAVVVLYKRFEIVRTIINTVATTLISAFAGAVAWVQKTFAGLPEAIGHYINIVRKIIEVVVRVIVGYWQIFGDDIMRIVGTVFDQVRATIELVMNVISGMIRFVLALINGDWGAAWQAVKDILGSAWEFIKTTIGNILGVLRGLGGAALSALGAVARAFFDAGRNLIQGLIDGIVSMAGKVVSTVKNKILDALPDFIAKQWRERSPSRVAYGLGQNFSRGLELGLLEGAKRIPLALAGVPGLAAARIPIGGAGAVPAAASPGTSGAPQIVQVVLDGRVIAETVAPHQRELRRERGVA